MLYGNHSEERVELTLGLPHIAVTGTVRVTTLAATCRELTEDDAMSTSKACRSNRVPQELSSSAVQAVYTRDVSSALLCAFDFRIASPWHVVILFCPPGNNVRLMLGPLMVIVR